MRAVALASLGYTHEALADTKLLRRLSAPCPSKPEPPKGKAIKAIDEWARPILQRDELLRRRKFRREGVSISDRQFNSTPELPRVHCNRTSC
eukprot:4006184-Amphidinium_carterae.1